MASSNPKSPQMSVLAFKQTLKDRISLFATDPTVFTELAFLRTVRRLRWDASLDYYGNRKHASEYRKIREAKEAGLPVPRGNSKCTDTSCYPLSSRIRLERETFGNHQMHAQLRRSIVSVLNYLVDKLDLVSGVCVNVKKKRYREIYVREIAVGTGLGKRTVQRALSNLSRHRLLNRGVALIGITPTLYKALGLYSLARAMAASLKALMQHGGYRGAKINPEHIKLHPSFHRFILRSPATPSLRKLLASVNLATDATVAAVSATPKVPSRNNYTQQSAPPPTTGPPTSSEGAFEAERRKVGLDALRMLKANLSK
ncbi:hypothetical protein SJI00_20965 [Pseudomonas sp. RP23018S]|uniref:hypothetical protein n=1 Tax=Pseudomonas sp. RP23018S TaxID=3096037 RepID=UPI002ACAFB18|nr:hypothetical protein [Pseudomonas sp. RP23018S]MDZ5605248.1 hypothetical protein [Pseudomonas sp. RP23018S]